MADSSPKRRKTKSPTKHSTSAQMSRKYIWPPGRVPVEIFELIISYLPRSIIQNMRLVNKEFETRVSGYLFRVVVVPFRPEIYGITPEPSLGRQRAEDLSSNSSSIGLQDKGLKVFSGFGQWIRKFAMSFEYDMDKLIHPPIKNDQEAITTFWGIYRWPFKTYNRYTQLEGLEMTADETKTMAKALKWINAATELGLSLDGGLGWLPGPDLNFKVQERGGDVLKVFGPSRFVPDAPSKLSLRNSEDSIASGDSELSPIERMLRASGYEGDALTAAYDLMLEQDEEANQMDSQVSTVQLGNSTAASRFIRRARGLVAAFQNRGLPTAGTPNQSFTALDGAGDDDVVVLPDDVTTVSSRVATATKKLEYHYPLKPNELTSAQKEMLLEIEWAQRAFMQSYTIAVIDNTAAFAKVATLTIARLPSGKLPILRREDFWNALPLLNSLSLAIIPDWREVVKLPTSWVQDNKLQPSKSVTSVYQILQSQISHRENIKTLHFEWLCGGEHAPGLFARNRHLLPAPLVEEATSMIARTGTPPAVLSLPHIEHLSLKNCWTSPHILVRFCAGFKDAGLKTLSFESVSLTADVPQNTTPNPAAVGAIHHAHLQNAAANWALPNLGQNNAVGGGVQVVGPPFLLQATLQLNQGNLLQVQVAQAQAAAAAAQAANSQATATPVGWLAVRAGSWANIIETLTPNEEKSIQFRRQKDNDDDYEAIGESPSKLSLKKLEFKSCGYVHLPLDFDQTAIDPPNQGTPTAGILKRMNEIDSYMMKPQDHFLGEIVNYIRDVELRQLQSVFVLQFGWAGLESPYTYMAAESSNDGILNPGEGRFTGVIEEAPWPTNS